ncbi:hypothetical protein Lfu02_62110 [Longispora fulva]|nr:hypothetical protein Lfu02_62110 [Longispora fulva]
MISVVVVTRILVARGGECGADIDRVGPERACVGVTDGGFVFHPTLAGVSETIRRQNADVTDKDAVTIAFAQPIPTAETGSFSLASIQHEMLGAAAAQREANASGAKPRIRLLIANFGESNEHWAGPVATLVRLAEQGRLRAVAGLGQSKAQTRAAMGELSRHGIPMVAAVITADNIHGGGPTDKVTPDGKDVDLKDKGGIYGLARVSPTNHDEMAAGLNYLGPDVLLVHDDNADDDYVSTLVAHFKALRPGSQPSKFNRESVANRMPGVVNEICNGGYRGVYFAGRGTQLRQLLAAFNDRSCTDGPTGPVRTITVLSGDDASQIHLNPADPVDGKIISAMKRNAVRLVYTGLAHPDQWKVWNRDRLVSPEQANPAAAGFETFLSTMGIKTPELTDTDRTMLEDGQAMMAYDAVKAAAAAVQRNVEHPENVELGGVQNGLYNINTSSPLSGSSGPIAFDEIGNPVNKAIPILRLTCQGRIEFVRLSYPGAAVHKPDPIDPNRC